MALIDKDAAIVTVLELFKKYPTRAIRAMYAINELEEVEAIPKETVKAVLDKADENAYDMGGYALGYGAAVEHIREELL